MSENKRKLLTDDLLRILCQEGMSDAKIGSMFDMTGEGIAYRRKKIDFPNALKITPLKDSIKKLKSIPTDILSEDYYSLTRDEFSNRYRLSKTVWLPYLRSLGVLSKNEKRINDFPPLTVDQQRLIIAGMLGDGGITEDGCYYEFHSDKQVQYLQHKELLLRPYTKGIKKVQDGYAFETITHPNFKKYRELFYSKEVKGKLIPVDFIKNMWDDSILAYWFFDDGSFDDDDGVATIANFCPVKEHLAKIAVFLNDTYKWEFSCTKTGLFLPKRFSRELGKILIRYATPDVYYKIPEECISPSMVSAVSVNGLYSVKPKFYRVCNNEELKLKIEDVVFNHYRKSGFPFKDITETYTNYLIDEFVKFKPKEENGIIIHNTAGQNLCEYFFPNIYECHRKGCVSPLESWQDDEYLKKLVKNRLQYADRLTPAAFRTGIKLTKACVSNFKPAIAKYLYSQYCINGKLLDYSCGFGSRMLAAMSLGMEYSGFEPAEKTHANLLKFGTFLQKRIGGSFDIKKSGSEEAPFKENYFGFAFSSPPYYDFEHYSKDLGQSIVKFPSMEDWHKGYWFKTMENCYRSLIDEGFFGICLSSTNLGDLFDRTFAYAKEIGFYFHRDYAVPFKHVFSGGDKSETILIFSKKPSNATPVFYGKKIHYRNFSPIIKDGFIEVSGLKRKVASTEEINAAVLRFKESAPTKGVSRDLYKDGSLGVAPYVLEHKYGSWNKFVRSCGFDPGYEANTPVFHVEDYLKECLKANSVLSFYEYEKKTGKPSSRLKRLFNIGKPYHHLLEELRVIALNQSLWTDFLPEIN